MKIIRVLVELFVNDSVNNEDVKVGVEKKLMANNGLIDPGPNMEYLQIEAFEIKVEESDDWNIAF